MNQFYICIIFIGIVLMLISIVWILVDKKKFEDYCEKVDDKKSDLKLLIDDAELMIDEMNKFSDYVLKQFDDKEKDIKENLKEFNKIFTKKDTNSKSISTIPKQVTMSYSKTKKVHSSKIVNMKPEYEKILNYKTNGLSTIDIAKKLNMGVGEVNLIIEMNKKAL